ncbi:MAG: TIGR03936 family radical SAM-associated protein [Clostridiales bacterium]|nr:TIGR03936 family radical SAM-associated protein [Clostridiales bacterium]
MNQEKKIRFKYRVKYTKGPEVKFVSHLDLMRLFQRAVRRAGLPIGYSHGFNPHQLMSFGNPLSLGMTSCAEYCDMEFVREEDTDVIVRKLRNVMNDGIEIISAARLSQTALTAMADLCACEYEAYLDSNVTGDMIEKNLKDFLNQKEILAMKKTKSFFKETDIRPDIFNIENISDEDGAKLRLTLAAGSTRSLRADLTVQTFLEYIGAEYDKYKITYKRTEMYRIADGKFVPLDKEVAMK